MMEAKSETLIIDGHSHIGYDKFWCNNGDFDEYISKIKQIGISEANIMSVPCPVIIDGDVEICPLIHGEFGSNDYYKLIKKDNEYKKYQIPLGNNPYKLANENIFKIVENNNDVNNDVITNYVPLIHPYFYSYNDFIDDIEKGAVMFKIHGVSGGVLPQKISNNFLEILEELQIPVIIHTDVGNENTWLAANCAYNWYCVLKNYNIKVYFAHAARLDPRMIKIINNDDRYYVGIGPDKYLSTCQNYIIENYLKSCIEYIDINKLIFDIDYPWNIVASNNENYDWLSIERINELLSKTEREKVLSRNIKNFFRGGR